MMLSVLADVTFIEQQSTTTGFRHNPIDGNEVRQGLIAVGIRCDLIDAAVCLVRDKCQRCAFDKCHCKVNLFNESSARWQSNE
jgi:hypothetical protein